MKDAQPEEEGKIDDVEISKVDSACLEKVVEFLKHYHDEPMTEIITPLEDNTFDGVVKQQWYRDFINGVDQPLLFELLMAANFMSIRKYAVVRIFVALAHLLTPRPKLTVSFVTCDTEPLLDLACLKVSDKLMGKSPEEIRVLLNIPKMTPEEEAKARTEYRWIFND